MMQTPAAPDAPEATGLQWHPVDESTASVHLPFTLALVAGRSGGHDGPGDHSTGLERRHRPRAAPLRRRERRGDRGQCRRTGSRHHPAARRPVPRPDGQLAAVQRPGSRARRGPRRPAARASQVHRHLLHEPRRVLHGAGGRPPQPGRRGRDEARSVRSHTARAAGPGGGAGPRAGGGAGPAGHRGAGAGTGQGEPHAAAVGRAQQGRAPADVGTVRRADPPGAHAPRGRPGAPFPVHLPAVPQPGRGGGRRAERRRALRTGEGAAAAPAPAARRRQRHPAGPHRGGHRRPPRRGVPRHESGRGIGVPGHPQRGLRRRRGRRERAARAGAGAVPPPVRRTGPARGPRRHQRPGARPAGPRAGHHRRRGLPDRCPPGPVGVLGPRRDRRSRRPAVTGVPFPAAPCPARAGRRRGRHRRRHAGR